VTTVRTSGVYRSNIAKPLYPETRKYENLIWTHRLEMLVLLIPTLPNPAELLRRTTSIIINNITALGVTVCSNTFCVQVEQ